MSAIPTQTPADMAVQTLKVDSCVNAPRVTTEQDTGEIYETCQSLIQSYLQ